MDILIKTPFFQTLFNSTLETIPTRYELEKTFQDFALTLASVCDRTDKKNALRILNYTQIELQAICRQIKANKLPVIMLNYAIKAEQLLKAENKYTAS